MLGGRIGKSPRPKYTVDFEPFDIHRPTLESKVGGYPDWIGQPAWPVDNFMSYRGMNLFAQIRLSDKLFPQRKSDMAYIFVGEDDDQDNNAVVLQSPTKTYSNAKDIVGQDFKLPALMSFNDPIEEQFLIKLNAEEIDEPRLFQDEEKDLFWEEYWKSKSKPQICGLPFFEQSWLARANGILGDIAEWNLLFCASCDCEFPLLLSSVAPEYFVFVNHGCTEGRVVGFWTI